MKCHTWKKYTAPYARGSLWNGATSTKCTARTVNAGLRRINVYIYIFLIATRREVASMVPVGMYAFGCLALLLGDTLHCDARAMIGDELFGCGAYGNTSSLICHGKVTCFVSYHTFNAFNQLVIHKDRPMCNYHIGSVRLHCKVPESIVLVPRTRGAWYE